MAALRRICVGLDGKIRDRFSANHVEIVQPGRIQSTSEYPFTFFRSPPRAQVTKIRAFFGFGLLANEKRRCTIAAVWMKAESAC
jgi:hypothetical protein